MQASGNHVTAVISSQHEFNAPAEVVFGVLTDPDRRTRWLPQGMRTESAGLDHVRVRAGGQAHEYDVSSAPDQLRVEWRARGSAGLHGAAWVRDAPAGGCVVHAEVTVPGGHAERQRAEELLAESMGHLQRDVSDNFNAG
ncbi:SRPBCC family protein [Actinoplanes sp. NPDC026623]|uniref:SRPBCC family protein n=1 Tax=Actinoplanes sp. NPDC026623 TaxID=3155610 RepID=UPI00340AADFB